MEVDAILGLVFGGGTLGLLLWAISRMTGARHQQDAAAAATMEDYHQAMKQAFQNGDSEKIIAAGRRLIDAARYYQPGSQAATADRLYRSLLIALKEHPELRPFILEVGRFAKGAQRQGGMPTIYDEQAIANDITAHQ